MNEDYSNLIKNFSEILKEKNIDINTIIPNNSSSLIKSNILLYVTASLLEISVYDS